ncbi:MAG: division plane positioning ATPase MipZ, partial [Pseudomonadota bacterium]
EEKVAALKEKAGFDETFRVCERVVHRAMCLDGSTVFDPKSGGLTLSELAARSEIRRVLGCIPHAAPIALAA